MTTDSQALIDAVEAGETTDPGGMTTTQDVADVVPESYWTVEKRLRALRLDGQVESKIFGNERVWVVPDDGGDEPQRDAMPTSTREQPAD